MGAAAVLYSVRFIADALTAMRCVRIHIIVQFIAVLIVLIGGMLALPTAGMLGMVKVLLLAFFVRGVILFAGFWWMTRSTQAAGETYSITA